MTPLDWVSLHGSLCLLLNVLIDCPLYNELRRNFFQLLHDNGINIQEKLPMTQFTDCTLILNNMDEKLIRMSAKY